MIGMHFIGSFPPERVHFQKRDKKERREKEPSELNWTRGENVNRYLLRTRAQTALGQTEMWQSLPSGVLGQRSASKQTRQVQFQMAPGNAVIPPELQITYSQHLNSSLGIASTLLSWINPVCAHGGKSHKKTILALRKEHRKRALVLTCY